MVLAFGIGTTATYAFKTNIATTTIASPTCITYGIIAGLGYYDIINPKILAGSGAPACAQIDFSLCYCTITYSGKIYNVGADEYYVYQNISPTQNVSEASQGQYLDLSSY